MSHDEDELEKLVAPADFDGPTKNRHCTDVLCALLIFAMWAAMTYIGIYAVIDGDYRIVLYPLDYDGNVCGTDYAQDMTEFPYLVFVNSYTGGVCVKECPSLSGAVSNNLTDIRTMITYGGVWQTDGAELPADFVQMANYSASEDALFCSEETCFPNNSSQESWTSEGVNEGYGYAYYVGDTYPLLSYCYLTTEAEDAIKEQVQKNATLQPESAGNDFWGHLYTDLWTARVYILGFGFGVALGISFIYMLLLRLPLVLNALIWGSIFITIAMFFLIGYYTWSQAQAWDNEDPQTYSDGTIQAARIAAIVVFAVGGLLLLIMCCLRKQIQLAIGCVKQSARAVHAMPLIIILPVLEAAGFIGFIIVFLIYAVHLASMGEITVQEFTLDYQTGTEVAVRTYSFGTYVNRCAWYFLFCFFWTNSFIVAIGDLMVAMCFAKWYFTRDKSRVGSGTVFRSICATLWYHLGTCAYGSLILGSIQFIRAVLVRIQKKVKQAGGGKVADVVFCCCHCCLWCFEKCIKFLNKNAYVQTAIFGTSFCKSAREAFGLIVRNAARVGAISYVSAAVLIVGKLFISAVTTGLSYYLMNENIGDELYSIGGPTVFVFLISYFVSDFFMDLFDMGITTILYCFVADEEMFDGETCYAEGPLTAWIDKYEEH